VVFNPLDTADNQSLHQRVLHLIYDTKGVRYRPELVGVPLGFIFEIEDLGEFYMLSLIGEAEVPSLVSTPREGYKSLDYAKLTAVLVEAVKELRLENRELRERVEALESRR